MLNLTVLDVYWQTSFLISVKFRDKHLEQIKITLSLYCFISDNFLPNSMLCN